LSDFIESWIAVAVAVAVAEYMEKDKFVLIQEKSVGIIDFNFFYEKKSFPFFLFLIVLEY
jgi:hypothetical protein